MKTYLSYLAFGRMLIRILSVVVILAMLFPAVTISYAAPIANDTKELLGNKISLLLGSREYPPDTPFYISHGWVQSSYEDAIGIFDFELEVDGILRKEDFKDFWAESGDPDTLQRLWVFNFPNGMTGTHTFTGHWFAPCQYAMNLLEYAGPCTTPNTKVETDTATLTVNFTPTFVAYVPGAIEGYSWPLGDEIRVTINGVDYPETAFSEQDPNALEGATRVLFEVWRNDVTLKTDDHIVMTDLTTGFSKEVTVTTLAVIDINEEMASVSGLYDPDFNIWVWLYGQDWQIPVIDPSNGTWVATFDQLVPGAWGGGVQFDEDGDGTSIDFQIPQLVLYIHYEYPDVVEGSYELGHTVDVTVFDSEWNIKATATVATMEMPHWGGAPGFRVEQWDGMDDLPDIQPGDIVRAIVDEGSITVETHIGEIAGTINLETNSITGTINAPWAGDTVNVLCMPWGAPAGASDQETTIAPDGESEFTCAWDPNEWDIQPGETVGVAYWGDDLHWIANGFVLPRLDLRVNYGADWVESFFEAGHTISIQVKDADGNLKASAEVFTTARDEWGGAEGFQTRAEDWVPAMPDIQPYDWVYAQVDNGATAQVQIGEITGVIHLETDEITGTVLAPWFSEEVQIECHSWGAPLSEEIIKNDSVLPDGTDPYSCSWFDEWDIQPGQSVGVGYSGLDGHWIANTFSEG